MMDEFENNRENEHVDQTTHAETPYDTGDGNTDNLKRTTQQTEQHAGQAQQDADQMLQQILNFFLCHCCTSCFPKVLTITTPAIAVIRSRILFKAEDIPY